MQQLCLFDVEILFSGGCIVILYYWVKGKAKIKSFPSHVACTALERQGIGDFWRQVGEYGKSRASSHVGENCVFPAIINAITLPHWRRVTVKCTFCVVYILIRGKFARSNGRPVIIACAL